ncbi:YceI family protein [Brumimicrobium glaciale]|uniref:YceI family protein n=2 Tax=Brumimicrobium glaciale TaxID=200475 RepID=A0A4Q4KJZ9_9FLAO|nr:YceI family protein [Brumimicrobium glaciale]
MLMLIITAVFLIISGVFAAIAKVRKDTKPSEFIAVYILGISTLILTKDYLLDASGPNQLLTFLLIAVLSVSFAVGEIVKKKQHKIFLGIPIVLSGALFFYPQLASHSYLGHQIDDLNVLFIIAIISAITPILMHFVNALIQKLVSKFTPIKWNKTDEHLLESALAFAFIGGMAALGGFLLGKLGILIAATFFLSTSFIARNRTSISPSILLSTSGAMFLISAALIVLEQAGFKALDLTNGEVLQGIFMAGFIAVLYELFIRLAQHRSGKWRGIMITKAITVPLGFIFLLGFAYTQLERLGGVLTLTAMLIALGLLSVLYTTFKTASNIIGLKLFSLGFVLIIAPYFSPVKQSSGIDLGALGIEQSNGETSNKAQGQSYHDKLDEPNGQDLTKAIGSWKIDEEISKIFFELGPPSGRVNGEFNKVKGKFEVTENPENSTIKVILPVKNISTYNSMRDESLMDEEYFHEEKHPELTFDSKSFSKKEDGYLVEGTFTLLGITNPIDLTLKLVGVGEKDGNEIMVLWGKASLNRTDYGMPSSAKIGDVVDFHFEVQLTK